MLLFRTSLSEPQAKLSSIGSLGINLDPIVLFPTNSLPTENALIRRFSLNPQQIICIVESFPVSCRLL
jgi:hypothetical protein